MSYIKKVNQLNCNDKIEYECGDGKVTATVSHIRIGKNAMDKMIPWLSLKSIFRKEDGKQFGDVELPGNGLAMFKIVKV